MSTTRSQHDFVGAGFHRLDDTAIENHPPKIQWGRLYRDRSPDEKIRYLENLASVMNHAAATIQEERNKLGRLCELKESQLMALGRGVRQNNEMLQSEVTRMNAERKQWLAESARLRNKIRSLESGAAGV